MELIDKYQLEAMLKKSSFIGPTDGLSSAEWVPAVNKGDNYSGQIWRVNLQIQRDSGETDRTTVVVKAPSPSSTIRQFLTELGTYDRELFVYEVIFAEMEKLINERNDPRRKFWCNLLGHQNGQTLVFSDLKRMGYGLIPRSRGMEIKYALVTVKTLARFHAMGYILVHNEKITVNKLKQYVFARNNEGINKFYSSSFNSLFRAMKQEWGGKWPEVADRLKKATDDFGNRLQELGKVNESNFNVLNHGDIWINNIMFKEDPDDIHCMFVDFQGLHYNSYAWDLTYLLYSSLLSDPRQENFDNFLRTYRNELLTTFRILDFGPPEVPTIEEMEKEMSRLVFFALVLAATHLPSSISKPQDAVDFNELLEEGETNIGFYANEIYVTQFQKDLEYFQNKGVF